MFKLHSLKIAYAIKRNPFIHNFPLTKSIEQLLFQQFLIFIQLIYQLKQ